MGFGCNVEASRVVTAYAIVTNRAVLDKDLNVIYEMVNQLSFEISKPGYNFESELMKVKVTASFGPTVIYELFHQFNFSLIN